MDSEEKQNMRYVAEEFATTITLLNLSAVGAVFKASDLKDFETLIVSGMLDNEWLFRTYIKAPGHRVRVNGIWDQGCKVPKDFSVCIKLGEIGGRNGF